MADLGRNPVTLDGRREQTFEISFPACSYVVPTGILRAFAQLKIKYEDIERNLYELSQTFDLLQFTEGRFHWQVSYDCLYLIPLRSRTFIWDENIGMEVLPSGKVRVYERCSLQ